jgi:hypothetical protein
VTGSAPRTSTGCCARYDISVLQAEFSLTQMLDRPLAGRVFFEVVVRENIDLGRPDRVSLIFERDDLGRVEADGGGLGRPPVPQPLRGPEMDGPVGRAGRTPCGRPRPGPRMRRSDLVFGSERAQALVTERLRAFLAPLGAARLTEAQRRVAALASQRSRGSFSRPHLLMKPARR